MSGAVAIRANEQDVGPFRVDHLLAIWPRLARVLDALHDVGLTDEPSNAIHLMLAQLAAQGRDTVDTPRITQALRLLALQDGMHAGDWLRMKAVDAALPRKRAPATSDLQIRLKGLSIKSLVLRQLSKGEDLEESFRVTVKTSRGDVASCQNASFAIALEGALCMAGEHKPETTDRRTT